MSSLFSVVAIGILVITIGSTLFYQNKAASLSGVQSSSLWRWLKPTGKGLVLVFFLKTLSSLVIQTQIATSKISWEQDLAFPLAFCKVSAACLTHSGFCNNLSFLSFNPIAFLVDAVVLYLVAGSLVTTRVINRKK
jgi:hypothetical protein